MKLFILALLTIVAFSCTQSNVELSLIPQPNSIELSNGRFLLKKELRMNNSAIESHFGLDLLSAALQLNNIELKTSGNDAHLTFVQLDSLQPEAYHLKITNAGISIEAGSYNGYLYGIQTLIQLIDQAVKTSKGISLPLVSIIDEPAFQWRGMHLDVCRHYFDVDFIYKMLDAMAMHKLNTFHWHLTEDQGWRIEIEKYPLLTELSAWRSESVVGHMANEPVQYDGIKHGGFYTKAQIKQVVEYATKLGITIVPEIEMPGHAVAALMAYPELCCTGKPKPFNDWGISSDVYCAGNEKTFEFLVNVLAEVVELFPGEYIHVGGDECPKDKWEDCPKCQKRIKEEGLKDEHELQSYFIQRMERFLNSKGKKLIGWDEILEGGLADNAAVMSWRGEEGGIEAASQNHNVVMTPNPNCYFDHYQSSAYEPLAIGGLTTMDEIYNWSVIPHELAPDKHHFVLGAQANVWTEYIPTPEHAEYMIFPRLCALAEKVWTNESVQNFTSFTNRMDFHYHRLDAKGINYRIPYPKLDAQGIFLNANDKLVLEKEIASSTIYYTLDGTEPNEKSLKYTDSLQLDLSSPQTVKAVTIMPSGRKSVVSTGVYELVSYREADEVDGLVNGINYQRFNRAFSSAFDVKGEPDEVRMLTQLELPWITPVVPYGAILNGWIDIPEDGIYTFYLHVKDGGLFFLGEQLIVNNDGTKYGTEKNGKAALKAGKHAFAINYFMGRGWSELGLKYQFNDGEILPVKPEQYFTLSE